MSSFIIFNGSLIPSGSPLITADNRGFRYGDGLFETIRVKTGRIMLAEYHFERLLAGARLLQFETFPFPGVENFSAVVLELCRQNGHMQSARVRLNVFRGDMGQDDGVCQYVLQSWVLEEVGGRMPTAGSGKSGSEMGGGDRPDDAGGTGTGVTGSGDIGGTGIGVTGGGDASGTDAGVTGADRPGDVVWAGTAEGAIKEEKGLVLGIYPKGRKSCDQLANVKSNNYLIYSMAARYAGQHGWDDCLVLNSFGRVADSSIANLFWVKGGIIYTPPLSEGCVAGVMRRWLLEVLPERGLRVQECPVAPEDLIQADEIFLSNAIRGVRWVGNLAGTTYGNKIAQSVKTIIDGSFC